jgi:exopolysaccharide biosynthesis polyprenyl glycosylphosphotransferase
VRRLLVAADVLALASAAIVAEVAYPKLALPSAFVTWEEALVFAASLPGWIVVAKLYRLYDHDADRTDHSTADDFVPLFHMVVVCTAVFWFVARVTHLATPAPGKLMSFVVVAIVFLCVLRALARAISHRRIEYLQNTLIVGAGDVGQRIAQKLIGHPEYGINLVGLVDENPRAPRPGLEHVRIIGSSDNLPQLIMDYDVERVIIAFSNEPQHQTLALLRSVKDLDVQIDIVPRFFELLGPGVGMHTVEGLPLLGLPPMSLSRSSRFLKRGADLVIGAFAVLLFAPLFVLIMILIKVDSAGPVFFRQRRVGERDDVFEIWKFRTMAVDAESRKHEVAHLNMHALQSGDGRMFKVPGDPRTTRIGRVLRRYSLDELPQLFNVLVGAMSLVGPRPLIPDEDQHVKAWGRRRLDLKPGITGPWQVLGRSGIPFEEMVSLDYLYVTSWSMWGDIKLLMKTLPLFLRSANGETPPATHSPPAEPRGLSSAVSGRHP